MKKLLLISACLLTGMLTYAQEMVPSEPAATDPNTLPKYELVERSRRAHFVAGESYIKQEGLVIANYTIEDLADGEKKFTYILPNGTVAAVGMLKHQNAGKITVETMIDKKKHTVGLKNLHDIDIARETAMFLSDNKYL